MKTTPMQHQLLALNKLRRHRAAYGLFMEQGTGKSKVIIDEVAELRPAAVVIVAPNGVHSNWALQELPAHADYPYQAFTWRGSWRKADERLLVTPFEGVRWLLINTEAARTKAGAATIERFLTLGESMLVVDESTRIKNHTAAQTKALISLGRLAKYRRILNGTPITQAPLDVYAQLLFLSPEAVPVKSWVAFKRRYCEILAPSHPLVRSIAAKNRLRFAPEIEARDAAGRPIYRNLDELRGWVDQWAFRVLKSECLDLPEKVYKRQPVLLTPEHTKLVAHWLLRIRLGDVAEPLMPLHKVQCYQRLLHGIIPKQLTGEAQHLRMFSDPLDNSRIQALRTAVEDHPGQAIIWAKYITDIVDILEALGPENCYAYYGAIDSRAREEAVAGFQAGKRRFFVGQPGAGGVGLTLTAASTMIYYSNTFRLYDRLQSEDRAHRIGQHRTVVYIDLETPGTVDTKVIASLRAKKDVADAITGDPDAGWLDFEE